MPFTLHPQLAADTVAVGDLPVSRVLLMNNCNFPWLILVPKQDNLRELFDLPATDYTSLMQEIRAVSHAMAQHTRADKINIAALGNMVPQLHIHIIARFTNDVAWPKPVWNIENTTPYEPADLNRAAAQWREVLTLQKCNA